MRENKPLPVVVAAPRIKVTRLLLALCAAATLGACGIVPTRYDDISCPKGTMLWRCTLTLLDHCDCRIARGPKDISWGGCGTDEVRAAEDAEARLEARLQTMGILVDGVVRTSANTQVNIFPPRCENTGGTACGTGTVITCPYSVQTKFPDHTPQDVSSCDAAPGDNGCVVCAKSSCCDDYEACLGDASCLCWVGCMAAGKTADVCAQAARCGAPSAVSTAAAGCLSANCAAQCVPGDACACDGASSSAM